VEHVIPDRRRDAERLLRRPIGKTDLAPEHALAAILPLFADALGDDVGLAHVEAAKSFRVRLDSLAAPEHRKQFVRDLFNALRVRFGAHPRSPLSSPGSTGRSSTPCRCGRFKKRAQSL